LRRFLSDRDENAFTTLVRRHGPLVLAVCGRILNNIQDTEDAFQATFLVLISKARSIAKQASLASWLHGVARRVAVRLETKTRKREKYDRQHLPRPAPDSLQEVIWRDLRALLDEEVARLPGRYREPFVLCYMQGKTNEEAAKLLGCAKGTIDSRLSRARERLRQRLVRRGLGVSAGLVATMLSQNAVSANVPIGLELLTIKSAVSYAAGPGMGLISKQVLSLTQEIVKAMFLTKLKIVAVVALFVGLTATGAGLLTHQGRGAQTQEVPQSETSQSIHEDEEPDVSLVELKSGVDLSQLQLEMAQKEYLKVVSDLRKAQVELEVAKSRPVTYSKVKLNGLIEKDENVAFRMSYIKSLEEKLEKARIAVGNDAEERIKRNAEDLIKRNSDALKFSEKELNNARKMAAVKIGQGLEQIATEDHEAKLAKLTEKAEYLAALRKALQADMDDLEKQAESRRAQKKSAPPDKSKIAQLEKEVRELKAQVEELKKRK
jgi:RNA polymerase sigma factor (sigma-70 family)